MKDAAKKVKEVLESKFPPIEVDVQVGGGFIIKKNKSVYGFALLISCSAQPEVTISQGLLDYGFESYYTTEEGERRMLKSLIFLLWEGCLYVKEIIPRYSRDYVKGVVKPNENQNAVTLSLNEFKKI